MTANSVLQIVLYLLVLTACALPLGHFMASVYLDEPSITSRVLGPFERLLYRVAGLSAKRPMTWKQYAGAVIAFNLLGTLIVYGVLRGQSWLPFNPQGQPAVPPELAFNTAISFATNTNWQAYAGETTLSYAAQSIALTVQNFVSAATGMAVVAALIRAFSSNGNGNIGNFWNDLVRSVLYVLLPLSMLVAVVLVWQGVVQTWSPYQVVQTLDGNASQILALGPAASQVAIKQLGTNGGGFFNANSAHPFENPTSLSNFVQLFSILIIPAALCFTFGKMVKDKRQGWAIYGCMLAIFVPLVFVCVVAEQRGTPLLSQFGLDTAASQLSSGGNMEGKDVRFGITNSALWATATTAASNGSVNAMHDSFTPLGGLVPMFLIQLGEIIFGGVGSGLYGILMYAIVAVFISGLMVGRTPEYLGKKIEAFEMKMASLVILFPAAAVLVGTAVACMNSSATSAVANPGAHGFSELLYAFSSGANNNGSAFGGLTASGTFLATAIGICMLIGRYWVIVPVLAIAGSLARKAKIPPTSGTLPTHTPLFVTLLVGTILLIGALTFIPAIALGPVVEHMSQAKP